MEAMPRVTTQNTTGTTIILTSPMNQSLSGLSGLADVREQEADGDAEDGADDDLEPELADQGAESGSPLWGSAVVAEVDMMGAPCGAMRQVLPAVMGACWAAAGGRAAINVRAARP